MPQPRVDRLEVLDQFFLVRFSKIISRSKDGIIEQVFMPFIDQVVDFVFMTRLNLVQNLLRRLTEILRGIRDFIQFLLFAFDVAPALQTFPDVTMNVMDAPVKFRITGQQEFFCIDQRLHIRTGENPGAHRLRGTHLHVFTFCPQIRTVVQRYSVQLACKARYG